jgi:hypothetical protein
MKKQLTGIVQLKGKWIRLEDIANSKIARVAHERLKSDCFNFWFHSDSGYIETKESDENSYAEGHAKVHNDSHNDSHSENLGNYTDDSGLSGGWGFSAGENDHNDHIDKGYSETILGRYSEHTDHY